jgi:hypothetical protein
MGKENDIDDRFMSQIRLVEEGWVWIGVSGKWTMEDICNENTHDVLRRVQTMQHMTNPQPP